MGGRTPCPVWDRVTNQRVLIPEHPPGCMDQSSGRGITAGKILLARRAVDRFWTYKTVWKVPK